MLPTCPFFGAISLYQLMSLFTQFRNVKGLKNDMGAQMHKNLQPDLVWRCYKGIRIMIMIAGVRHYVGIDVIGSVDG